MLFLFNYIKLTFWLSLYYFKKGDPEIIEDIIIKNIKECGCIAIKFTQWILPKIESIYEVDFTNNNFTWFKKLETLYDDCNEHSFEYTKYLYSKGFNSSLEKDYEVIELIGSGSIGQVYKVKSKIDNKIYALKCLHPELTKHINFFYLIVWLMYNTPIIKSYVRYYLPIRLIDFIKDFKTQINLINEGNNCLKFFDYYRDNDMIIIPSVSRMTNDILIMSYEDGIKFEDTGISEYDRNKVFILVKLFIKNNEHILNFLHGDLHKGNWRIRIDDKDIKLVIYDFGFCWYIPDFLIDHLQSIDGSFHRTSDESLDNFAHHAHILVNKVCSREDILMEVKKIRTNTDLEYDDPLLLFKLILNTMRNTCNLIDSYVIQSLIIHNQLSKDIIKYEYTFEDKSKSNKNRNKCQVREYYQKRLLDVYNYCETYDIFKEFLPLLKDEYEINKKYFDKNEIDYIDGFNYEEFRELALS